MKPFNSFPATWMHVDLNSCFATIEQQANPLIRGKPIAVCAYTTPRGCILAPSIEAKRFGIKTGMQVREGKALCPHLLILPSDPPKYRFVNRALLGLIHQYTPEVSVRSIDEMLLHFDYLKNNAYSPLTQKKESSMSLPQSILAIGKEIKQRIKVEIGEWLTVSIGISTNPYLAKLAAGLHKPDGLDEINRYNILQILSGMKLTDLPYIKERNQIRLHRLNIKTPVEFYFASTQQLKAAFESIQGYYWYLRLHGYSVDEVEWQRKSIGHQYALPTRTSDPSEIEALLCKLVEKVGRRLRSNQLTARGIHLAIGYDEGYWHKGHKYFQQMYTSQDLFLATKKLLTEALPLKPVRSLAITSFALEENLYDQMCLFHDEIRKRLLSSAMDKINDRWGEFSLFPGTMLTTQRQNKVLDRIAFGSVMDMRDVVLREQKDLEREAYID